MNSDLRNKRARASEPHYWNDDIEQATGRAFNWRCPFCDTDLAKTRYHRAHIQPVGSGVGLIPGNVVLTCLRCNTRMHSIHTWDYCNRHGIEYDWIEFTLRILERVFPVAPINPVTIRRGHTYHMQASKIVREFFQASGVNPDGVDPMELANRLQVGKSTVYKVLAELKAR